MDKQDKPLTKLAAYSKMKADTLRKAQGDLSLPAAHKEMIDLCLTKLRMSDGLANVQKQIDVLLEAEKEAKTDEQPTNAE